MEKPTFAAIVLAAGKGKRMGTDKPKQYMDLAGKPMLCYSLEAFEKSPVDGIVLVTGADETEYCKKEIVEKYRFSKVEKVVAGGAERFLSVYEGLKQCKDMDYVLIHDGARPFLTEEVIKTCMDGVVHYGACVCAVPAKDTMKLADTEGFCTVTPQRDKIWQVQTPQCFSTKEICAAYERMQLAPDVKITDDAMVMELFGEKKVKLLQGDYNNIKITTPEDLMLAEVILKK